MFMLAAIRMLIPMAILLLNPKLHKCTTTSNAETLHAHAIIHIPDCQNATLIARRAVED